MSILRKASQETKRLFLDKEETEFLEVLTDLSKRDFNNIVSLMPGKVGDSVDLTVREATDFQRALFVQLVKGWSLDEPVSGEAYDELSAEAGSEVDLLLSEHFATLSPGKTESKARSTSRGSGAKA